jgi:benzoate membrane transport protein
MRDLHAAAWWAGLTAFVWYAFGAVPLHISVSEQLGLTTAQTSSWIFIVWFSGAVSSIAASLYFRQPIPITWTIPGLVYLGTLVDRFSFAELVGANLVAGVLLLALGILGIGGRIMRWLPLPIIMGMFAGSILEYIVRMVRATVEDVAVAGTVVGCYLLGRLIGSARVPPVGLAVIGGGIAVAAVGTGSAAPVEWTLPVLAVPGMEFSASAIVAVSLPMVVLAMGLGNIQGLGFLTVARTGVAILASADAGPATGRYWAAVIAAALTIIMSLAASPLASLLNVLPRTYVVALAGVAIISSLQDALEKSFGGSMRFGALVALVVAATPFSVLGITSAFWAILAGVAASGFAERRQLIEFWTGKGQTG